MSMITKELDRTLDQIVEQKILEFFGDPDSGLELKKEFLKELRNREKHSRKFVAHKTILKKYGI